MSLPSCSIPRYQPNKESVPSRHKGLDFLLNTYVAKSLLKPWLSSKNIYDLLIAYYHNDLFLTIKHLADIYEGHATKMFVTIRKHKYLDGIYDLNVSGQLEISLTEMELRSLKIDRMKQLSIENFITFSSFNVTSRSLQKLELDCQHIQDDHIDVFNQLPQASHLSSLSITGLSDKETVPMIEKVSVLSRLTEFKFKSLIGKQQIATLLNGCPHLKSIALKTKMRLTQIIELIPHQTAKQWETISLEAEKVTHLEAVNLLKKFSSLKTLELISDFKGFSSPVNGYFYELDKLILERLGEGHDRQNNDSGIENLVSVCPNLSHIGLKCFTPFGHKSLHLFKDQVNIPVYPRLKTVDLFITDLSSDSWENLWRSNISLHSLYLYACMHGGMIEQLNPCRLNQLRHFSSTIYSLFNKGSLFDREVLTILTSAPFLSSLELHNDRFHKESDLFLGLEEKSLPHLKEVSLSGSQISARSIQILLKAAVNIRSLDLTGWKKHDQICFQEHYMMKECFVMRGCLNIKEAFDSLQANELLNLEQVYVAAFNSIDKAGLEKLMKGAPHIQGIFLRINKDFMNILPQLESGHFISLASFCQEIVNKQPQNLLDNKKATNSSISLMPRKTICARIHNWFSSIFH
ncbi:MAG: hypothetical protein ACOVOR_04030 [Rhabdochlamydiaceae bacterium]